MTKTKIQYNGFNEVMDDTIRRYCSESKGLKGEISSGYYIVGQKREIIFDGEFLDVHNIMELKDIGMNYKLTITLEE